MQTQQLEAEPRTILGKKVRVLRRQGIVPANVFGHGESRAIQAPLRSFETLLTHGGRTGLVNVNIQGSEGQTALVKHVMRDPRSGTIIHVDLQAVSLSETVTSMVPIRFVGEPPAVKQFGGVLLHPTTDLRVEARARDLPESIEVDISVLTELDTAVHVSDLRAPAGVTLLDPPEEVIAVVQASKVQQELAEEAAEAEAVAEAEAAETEGEAEAAVGETAASAEPESEKKEDES